MQFADKIRELKGTPKHLWEQVCMQNHSRNNRYGISSSSSSSSMLFVSIAAPAV
jgi:hypothetical protein